MSQGQGQGHEPNLDQGKAVMRLKKGRYTARLVETAGDMASVLALRRAAFRGGRVSDADGFDRVCRHLLVEGADGVPVCCLRLLPLCGGGEIARSYSAQFYDLSGLAAFNAPMVELGRFCIRPGARDPDILRMAWAATTRYVDDAGIALLFGCSSFRGTQSAPYADAFAILGERHLAPKRLLPKIKAGSVIRFAQQLKGYVADPLRAARTMPPLLRSYLAMGGWVSDHAVIDRDLDTLHVFTALEVTAIPSGRVRLLRAAAAV